MRHLGLAPVVLVVLLVLLYPYATAVFDDGPRAARLITAGLLSTVLVGLALAATAALLLCDWRLTRDPRIGVAVAMTVFVAVQDVPLTVLALRDPTTGGGSGFADEVGHVVVAVGLAALVVRARHDSFTFTAGPGPVAVGVLLGLAAFTARFTVSRAGGTAAVDVDPRWDLAVVAVMGTAAIVILLNVWHLEVARSTRLSLIAAAVLLLAAATISTFDDRPGPSSAAAPPYALAAALLLAGAADHLRHTVAEHLGRIASLAARAATSEAEVRREREVAHEVRSTVAGIAAAMTLLTDESGGAREKGPVLAHMVNDEVGRLTRLVSGPPTPVPGTVPVDEVLAPLVTAQRAMGHDVKCPPQGAFVLACRDSLASALDILLTNAARHGASPTTVTTEVVHGRVELRVRDHGPGVAPDEAHTLFEWGRRGADSTGDGIGLHLARRLVREQGGELELEPTAGRGATFLMTLPAAPDR